MRLRFASLTLAVVLLTGALIGCSGSKSPKSSSNEVSSKASSKTQSHSSITENESNETITSETSSETESSQAVQTSSEESEVETDDRNTSTPSEEVEDVAPSGIKLDPLNNPKLNNDVQYTLYHYSPGQWNLLRPSDSSETSFINCHRTNSYDAVVDAAKNGQKVWLYIHTTVFDNRETLEFKLGWEENWRERMEAYKTAGYWDDIIGFELEELCMGMSAAQFIKLTKFLAENYPGKRILAVASRYEVVEGTAPSDLTITPMTYKTYGYVTDIGYDWYSNADYNLHRDLVALIKKQVERPVRIWFYPSTHIFSSSTNTEDYLLQHLDMCFRLLKEEKAKGTAGGMMLYTWATYSKPGLIDLVNPNGSHKFERLAARIVEIGKEISSWS